MNIYKASVADLAHADQIDINCYLDYVQVGRLESDETLLKK